MKTLRIKNWVGAVALCWLMTASAALGQTTITHIPGLGAANPGTTVRGLNNAGQVAGYSRNAEAQQHAFLFSNGVLHDLGTLGGSTSVGTGLNDLGVVAGYSDTTVDGQSRAFVYRDGALVDLGVLPGAFSSLADISNLETGELINNAGDVVGFSDQSGFIYRNGEMTDLGSLGGGFIAIDDVNENGHVVGMSADENFAFVAFHHDGTNMHNLGTLGGWLSEAYAINDSGVIVGLADNEEGMTRAFVYRNGTMTDLGTLGGDFSRALEINNAGQILGESEYESGNTAVRGFIVDNGVMIDLGTLGGTVSRPYGMNSHGHVVGLTLDEEFNQLPFLYRDGQMVDVNTLLPANSGWVLQTANFINDAGQIVGYGMFNGVSHPYLLTPDNSNATPVADAGPDQNVQCSGSVRVDGSASTDADNDALSYEWRNGATVLGTSAVLDVPLSPGTYTLTLIVTDPNDASDEDTVTITVVDTTAPTVLCPGNQSVPAGANCQAIVPDFASAAIATDACSSSSVLTRSQIPAAGTAVSAGTHTVTVSVTDEAGNVGTCTVTLTVIDSTAPVGECPPGRTINAGAECAVAVPDFTAALLATDNCTAADALVKTQSPAAGTLVPPGTHVITLTVTDAAGNSSACSTTLTVESSRMRPSVTCPAGITAEAGAGGTAIVPDFVSAATIVDSCSGASTVTQSPAAGTVLGLGVHTVTIQAVDPAGNVGTCTTTFTVADTTAPTITAVWVDPSLLTENNQMVAVAVSVTATDTVDSSLESRIVSITSSEPVTGRGDNTSPDWVVTDELSATVRAERAHDETRIYTITVSCTDDSGNVSTATTAVTVIKRTKGNGGPGKSVSAASTTTKKKARKK
jgi:probable HAF family extracellular repeat protein